MTAAPAPAVTLAPTTVAFGSRTVNTTSPASAVTLTNSGTSNLLISNITSSGDFAFTTNCPILTPPLAALATCNINITFTPLTVAALTGNVTITSNAPGSPHVIGMTGTGASAPVPGILVSPSSVNLGNVTVGISSTAQPLTITNTGLATLNLTAIAVTGSGFARVTPALASPPNCATSLAPSTACQIAITFTAAAAGAASGQLSITHNATGSPTLIALVAVGTPVAVPAISVTGTIAFGDQIITTSGTQPLNITNRLIRTWGANRR